MVSCEICEEREAEYRDKNEGDFCCKKCLKICFKRMKFEQWLEDCFIEVESSLKE